MQVGVLLSGCGVYDGAEVYESVITLLALDRAGVEARCFAPNIEQMHVVNHLTGDEAEGETRNVLVEAARMCRGQIEDVANASAESLDALPVGRVRAPHQSRDGRRKAVFAEKREHVHGSDGCFG